VDATILHAPSSTKNKSGQRDPEMHQVRKGRQWYFGRKAHIGVDAETKLIHSIAATAAHVADCRMLLERLHGRETEVWGGQAYQGQAEVLRQHAPNAQDRINRLWRTRLKVYLDQREESGLAKNLNRLETTGALINLCIARKHLLEVASMRVRSSRITSDLPIPPLVWETVALSLSRARSVGPLRPDPMSNRIPYCLKEWN
jgi:IS5 family transposase